MSYTATVYFKTVCMIAMKLKQNTLKTVSFQNIQIELYKDDL